MSDRGNYRSIYNTLPDNEDFKKLSKDAKLLFLIMKVSRFNNIANIFFCDEGTVLSLSKMTGITTNKIEELLKQELTDTHWIAYRYPIVWVINGLKYEPNCTLSNQKHIKAVENILKGLPKSELIVKYCDYYDLAYPYNTLSIPSQYPADTGDRDITETETETDISVIFNLYNNICKSLPKLKSETETRKRAIRTTIEREKIKAPETFFTDLFYAVERSDFLTGRSGKWSCGFDWILKPANMVKILEGNYRNKTEPYTPSEAELAKMKAEQKRKDQEAAEAMRKMILEAE